MNRTLRFARLDFLTIKPYLTLKNMLLFLLVFGFVGYGTREPATVSSMLMMYGVIYASYPFAVGDKNAIDTLYATLPITKAQIVAGRYVFALSLNIIVGAIAFAVSALLTVILRKAFSWTETLMVIVVCFLIFSILLAAQLPIYFRLGYAKAKFLAYLPLAAFPAAAIAVSAIFGRGSIMPFIERLFLWMAGNSLVAAALVILLWVLIMVFSAYLSCRFYKRREF